MARGLTDTDRLTAVAAAQQEISRVGSEQDEVLRVVAVRAQSMTGAPCAAILVNTDAGLECRASAGPASARLQQAWQPDQGVAAFTLRTRYSLLCTDTRVDSRVDRDAAKRLELQSLITVLFTGSSPADGILLVGAGRPGAFSEQDVFALELLSGIAAAAIRQAQSLSSRDAVRDQANSSLLAGQQYRTLIEKLPAACYIGFVDETSSSSYVSPQIETMLGYPADEWISDPDFWRKVLHPDDRERMLTEHARHCAEGGYSEADYRMIARDGREVWVTDQSAIVSFNGESEQREIGIWVDITRQKTVEAALQHQVLHDPLTKLPNRTLLLDRLTQAILLASRLRSAFALVLLDLDQFKEINDTFGHQTGDDLLAHVGERLCGLLRDSDTVARLGGDEFAIVLPDTDLAGARLVTENILESFEEPFLVQHQKVDISASIGVALYPEHGEDDSALLRRADVAMYLAKRTGDAFYVYEPEEDKHSLRRLALMGDLRQSLQERQLYLHYQPICHIETGSCRRVEALVRWRHPVHGLVPPGQFISLAESTGSIKELSIWVLYEAIDQSRRWQDEGIQIKISVNISPRVLLDAQFSATVSGLLATSAVKPSSLAMEVTEGAIVGDPKRAKDVLQQLHDMGIWLSIDDFGMGYSSLAHLKRLPFDEIKIDKSFVIEMAGSEGDAVIVRSIIELGHNLGLQVVAEGVESARALEALGSMHCDLAQGFHIGVPRSASQYTDLLRENAASVFEAG